MTGNGGGDGLGKLTRPEWRLNDVDDELRFHLEGRIDELVAEGWTKDDARVEAFRQFGDMERYRAECRQIATSRGVRERRGEMIARIVQDVHFALRSFRRSPGFVGIAVLTLALGIGATTAVFTVAKNVMFDPLPFERPGELVMVYEQNLSQNVARDMPSPPNFADWRRQNTTFVDLAAMTDGSVTLSGIDNPTVVGAAFVSGNALELLGVEAQLGRVIDPSDAAGPEEAALGDADVVLISDRLWRSLFTADPGAVGSTIRLNEEPLQVAGVMAPSFAVPYEDVDLWIPADFESPTYSRQLRYLRVFGRLAPGVDVLRAKADLDRIQRSLGESFPESNAGWTADVVPVIDEVLGASTARMLVLLLAAAALVLLIACANVANLLLGRSTNRQREISVRTALGASRGRVVAQLLTESVVLAGVGGAVGIALASFCVQSLVALEPAGLPRVREIGMDPGSLAFALGASLLTAVLFGLMPALHSVRSSVSEALRGTAALGRGASQRARSALVISEVAVSLVLLVGAGLLVRSLLALSSVDPGFEPDDVLVARVNLDRADYPTGGDRLRYFEEMLRRLGEVPGVTAAGVTSVLPMDPAGIDFGLSYLAEGHPARPESELPETDYRIVSPGYFEAIGMDIVRGRPFTDLDRPETPRVVVINESFAAQLWPGEDPVGRTITIYYVTNAPWEVVGVVRDTRHRGLGAPAPAQMFVPLSQAEVLFGYMHFAVRTARTAPDVAARMRAVGVEVDAKYPLYELSTLRTIMAATTERDRLVTLMLGAFALLALGLAAVGIHGVVAFQVATRTREIGLRMALGARGGEVVGSVLRNALALSGAGVALGALGAVATTRVVRSLLFEVSPLDPVTFVGVAVGLMAVACMAALVPAARAARMDPAGALRVD